MRRLAFIFLFVFCLCAAAHATPLQVQDDRGQVVRLNAPVNRIVTLTPHLTELVFAAGAGSKLVGVSANSDYPAAARKLPTIGGAGTADLERIVALKPDVVLAWLSGGQRPDVERLEALGIPVIVTEPRRMDDIARHIELIGRIAGTGYAAERAAYQFRNDLRLLRTRYASRRPVSVFYQVWHEPLMTINGQHIISEVIRLCGGRNVFENLPTLVPSVPMEALLAANPEAIFVSSSAAQREALIAEWREHTRLRAVHGGHVYFSDADLMHRATPRMLEGAKQMCENVESVRRSAANSAAR
jgi:iron complex transport system substrate-binding protein